MSSHAIPRHVLSLLAVFSIATSGIAAAATDRTIGSGNPLQLASGSIEALVGQVSGSVVQIAVTGYRPVTLADGGPGLARGRSIGSGVVIDGAGFIITNAHVVAGAERIDVVLPDTAGADTTLGTNNRSVPATLVGVASDLDLALLSVPLKNLPPLRLADPASIKQGELVFAFGSPDGLRNSVSMGMVSSVGRQADPNSAMPYVQTDAAINPGNSGGPLVDMNGRVVGINTFIRSASGGSEGLGFAIPSAVVAIAFPQLRDFGHIHRAITGLMVQSITPFLKSGLGLPVDTGLIVSDIMEGSPAALSGIKIGDVVTAIDDHPIATLTVSDFYLSFLGLKDGQALTIAVRRGEQRLTFDMSAVAIPHVCERDVALFDSTNVVDALGVLAAVAEPDNDADSRHLSGGVVVTARVETRAATDIGLAQGDIIHAVNGVPVQTIDELRKALAKIAADDAVVLQVERNDQLTFVGFQRN